MNDIYSQYKIRGSVTSTVTDNGCNFESAFKDFGIQNIFEEVDEESNSENFDGATFINVDFENPLYNRFAHAPKMHRCASHTLSLIVTLDAKVALTVQSFNMINHVAMTTCSSLWKEMTKSDSCNLIKNILGADLRKPVTVRWTSLYDSLSDIVQNKNLINEVMKQLNLPYFTQQDIDYIEEYIGVLKPIATGINQLQNNKKFFYGELVPTLLTINSQLYEINISSLRYCAHLLTLIRDSFHRNFKPYIEFDNSVNDALLATITHPYFKLRWVVMKNDCDNILYLKQFLQDLLIEELKLLSKSEKKEYTSSDYDDYYKFEDSSSEGMGTESYRAIQYLEEKDHTLKSLNQHPSIKKLFLKYNVTLPCSSPVEKLFSIATKVNAPQRSCLSDNTFESLVLLRTNKGNV